LANVENYVPTPESELFANRHSILSLSSQQQQAAASSSQQQPAAASSSQQQPAAASSSQQQPAAASSSQQQQAAASSSQQQQQQQQETTPVDSRYGNINTATTKINNYDKDSGENKRYFVEMIHNIALDTPGPESAYTEINEAQELLILKFSRNIALVWAKRFLLEVGRGCSR
jgi:hypothetical protein